MIGRSAAAPWLISAPGGWRMMPILLSGIASLVAAETLIGRGGALRAAWPIGAVAVSVAWLTGLGSVASAEFPQVSPPLADTVLGTPAAGVIFGVATAAWMLSTTVAPVLIIATARRATGLRRGLLTILATAAATPILTVVTSAVLLIAFATGQLPSERFAEVILTGAFLLATLVVAIGIFAACTARDDGVTGRIGTTARWVLRLLWLVIGAELTAVLAAVLGGGSGTPSTITASTVAVVLTIGFVAAYRPVAGRLEAFMALGPPADDGAVDDRRTDGESTKDGLAGLLSPRERDVLALIAQGRSNAAIAAELFLSERTIDSHVSSIFEKLGLGRDAGLNRRLQAAAAWIRADLARGRRVS